MVEVPRGSRVGTREESNEEGVLGGGVVEENEHDGAEEGFGREDLWVWDASRGGDGRER